MNLKSIFISTKEGYRRFQVSNYAKNLAKITIRNYDDAFRYFSEFFDVRKSCVFITKQTYEEYILYLKNNKKANETSINTYLISLRTFLHYLMDEGYIKRFKIKLLKTSKAVKETYTQDEIQKLLQKPDLNDFITYRNWVLTNYLAGTGNRLSTVCNIKLEDLDFKNEVVILNKMKNREQQILALNHTLIAILEEYVQIRNKECSKYREVTEKDFLFCDKKGNGLSSEAIRTAIRRYNKQHGVQKTSVHLYRHYFAKSWALNRSRRIFFAKIIKS